jgi:hypothetical protein
LGLYTFDKPKNPIDKQHNKETIQLAEQIRQKRENHLNKPEIYTGYEKEQLRINISKALPTKEKPATTITGFQHTITLKHLPKEI